MLSHRFWRDALARGAMARVLSAAVDRAGSSSAGNASRAMARYAHGDDAAFAEVYDGLAPRLHGYLKRLARNESLAEDLLQQTFLRMHNARARFHDGADVVPWAYAIARRVFLDHARSAKRLVPSGALDDDDGSTPQSPLPDAEAVLAAFELSGRLEAELEAMAPILREAFLLVREEGLSMAQAADAVGISVAAMKLRAHRAYERLRTVVRNGEEESR
jgi:RNA polymerase sigma-70 factor (ECF subfamily)